jgi:hypothetical protein
MVVIPAQLRLAALAWLLPLAASAAVPRTRRAEIADLSIEELANIQMTSVSKRPERLLDAAGLGVRHHRRRHPPLGRRQPARSAAPGAQPAGGAR